MPNQEYQQTLAQKVSYTGVGLHSGKEVLMTLCPAEVNTDIVFVRTDLPERPEIPAMAENVTSTLKATTLSANGAEVFTVEHLMAALAAMQIDNCRIEMNSPEPPVTDGSAAVFCDLILQAGRVKQEAVRRVYAVPKSFAVYEGDKYITIQPYDGYRISFVSINPHPKLGTQYFDIELTEESFLKEIARARTVGFMHEIKQLQAMGLGLGGSIENVVIFDEDKVLTPMRFEDELIRHKILDVVGDLYLLGALKGHVIAVKSGHAFNSGLAKQIRAYQLKEEEK
ncbi:UDP-3-O-acyl-N-acetylglucosamine deacetylase [Phascolarctobacterium faecium]|nr:UDP-3-O-acyl-N-acetylglucosamine deacetylase [Phascolarctobacterium faecium]MDM8108368.1 UDP-3-O-acyl-N-acetylglucosamine deacetylase [Phascolarctobacterium faecium]